jgi:hypothetical protein
MKTKETLITFARAIFDWHERLSRPARAIALANELAGREHGGVTTVQVDSGQTTPVTNAYIGAGKYLVWMIGVNTSATTRTAALCSGAATKAAFPLGISKDAPYQAGDWLEIEQFGATPGTQVGISAGAITDGDWVGTAAAGLIQSLATAASASYWCIGKATKTVTAAGQEISINPCLPFLLAVTSVNPNTYAMGTPV